MVTVRWVRLGFGLGWITQIIHLTPQNSVERLVMGQGRGLGLHPLAKRGHAMDVANHKKAPSFSTDSHNILSKSWRKYAYYQMPSSLES